MIGQKPQVHVSYRLPMAASILMGALAATADILQLLLKLLNLTGIGIILGEGLGWMLSMFVVFTNCLVFVSFGVNFLSGKRTMSKVTRFVGTFLVEFLPIVNLIPTLTIWTLLTVRESRREDRDRAKRNATMGEARHVQVHKRRVRERIARRVLEATPVTRAGVNIYKAVEQRKRDKSRGVQPSLRNGFGAQRASARPATQPQSLIPAEETAPGNLRRENTPSAQSGTGENTERPNRVAANDNVRLVNDRTIPIHDRTRKKAA